MQEQVVARAARGIAIQKLVPIGEYLDLADSTDILASRPERYMALAVAAKEIIRQFRTDEGVRDVCRDSTALLELLDNADYEVGQGALAESHRPALN